MAPKQDPARQMPIPTQAVTVGNVQEKQIDTSTYPHQLAQSSAAGYQFPMQAQSTLGAPQSRVFQITDPHFMGDTQIPPETVVSGSGQNQPIPFHQKPIITNHLPNQPVEPSIFLKTPKNPYWKSEPKFIRNRMEEPATHVQQEFAFMLQQVQNY